MEKSKEVLKKMKKFHLMIQEIYLMAEDLRGYTDNNQEIQVFNKTRHALYYLQDDAMYLYYSWLNPTKYTYFKENIKNKKS